MQTYIYFFILGVFLKKKQHKNKVKHETNILLSASGARRREQNILRKSFAWCFVKSRFYYPFNNTSMKTICTRYITF